MLKIPDLKQILSFQYIAYRFLSLFFLFGFYCAFVALFASFEKADFFFKIFFILLAFTNSLKMLYRQESIIPYDLQFLKTPFSFFTMVNALYLLLFLVFFIFVYVWIHKTYQKIKQGAQIKMILKKRLLMIIMASFIFTVLLQINQVEAHEFEKEATVYFYQDDPVQIYEERGFLMGFASNLPGIKMYPPQNYSKEEVIKVMGKYEKEAVKINADRSAYREVLDILKRKDEQDYFIHLVTMQNHAKYSDTYANYHFDVKAPLSRKSQDQIRYYTEGIYESDQATRDFVKALEALDRKVLLVFYGDHLPSLYHDLKEQNDLWSLSMTDYFILSNFALGKSSARQEAISPIALVPKVFEYSGVKISPYQALLISYTDSIPYVKSASFYNHDMEARAYEDLSEKEKELIYDYYLIQYDMIERK